MAASTTLTAISMTVALALLGGVGAALGSGTATELIDRRDTRMLHEGVRKDPTARNLAADAARSRLRRDGFDEDHVERVAAAIRRRLLKEIEAYVDSLRGRRFTSLDEARKAVAVREKILCYDASTWPEGYGSGRPLTFVVDQRDVEELLGRLDAMIRSRETPLRTAVRELTLQREMTSAESRALRDFSRLKASARARAAIEEIRGAQFFSKEDAIYYVENAVGAELDGILTKLRDPATQRAIIEEARLGRVFGS